MTVYLNGRMVAAADARIDVADRGLTLGDGLYETVAVRANTPRRVDAHMARLARGAEVTGIGLPAGVDGAAIADALVALARANDIAEGVLRLTLTRGPAPRGLMPAVPGEPTLLITATAQQLAPPLPVRAVIATVTRRNEFSPLSRIKSTNCLDNILAAGEAQRRGADDALLLNSAGRIAEATVANLFAVIDGVVVTPAPDDGALAGVMRADVISALDAVERSLTPGDLVQASEAFLTNSLAIRPAISVDGTDIGAGAPGPVCEKLQEII